MRFFSCKPLYANLVTAEDLLRDWTPEGEYIYEAPQPNFLLKWRSSGDSLVRELAAQVRQALTEHKSTVKLTFTGVITQEFIENVFDEALLHTGVPNEGDYLKWSYGGWSAKWTTRGTTNILTYTVRYYTSITQEQKTNQAFLDVYNTISSALWPGSSDMRIARTIYDYVINTVEYDNDHADSYLLKHTAYAALINHKAVCQGYALVMYRLLLMFNIDARIAVSLTHAWNYANIDGKWYQLDATWGDDGDSVLADFYADLYFLKKDGAWTDSAHVLSVSEMEDYFVTDYSLSQRDFVSASAVTISDSAGKELSSDIYADCLNDSIVLYSKVTPSNAKQTVVCETDNEDLVSVSSSADQKGCLLEFNGCGDAVITMRSLSDTNVLDKAELHIVSTNPAKSLILTDVSGNQIPAIVSFDKYQVPLLKLKAEISPSDALKNLKWESSNPAVVNISESSNNDATLTFGEDGESTVSARVLDGSGVKAEIRFSINGDHVQSITVAGPDTIFPGKSAMLSTSYTPATAANHKFVWSALVDGSPSKLVTLTNGKLTVNRKLPAPSIIRVTVTATDGSNVEGYKDITVLPLIDSVQIFDGHGNALDKTHTVGLNESNNVQLRVKTYPEEASDAVTWKSSTPKTAVVDSNGLVTFLKPGTVTITAAAADGTGKKDTVRLTGKIYATDIILTGPETAAAGKSCTINALVLPENADSKKLTWSVLADGMPTNLAKISNGRLTVNSKMNGGVILTVTAKAADGSEISKSTDISVVPVVTAVKIISSENVDVTNAIIPVDLNTTSALQLRSVVEPELAGDAVTWKSSSPKIASVDNGYVSFSGDRFGTVTITAAAADGSNKRAVVKLNVTNLVNGITLSGPEQIVAGKTGTFTFTVSPGNAANKRVKWSVTEEGNQTRLASVSNGRVSVRANWPAGKLLYLTAEAADGSGVTASQVINIIPRAQNVSVSVLGDGEPVIYLEDSDNLQLQAQISPENAQKELKWTVSSSSLASVDQNGLLTAKRAGKVTVKAAAQDGSGKTGKLTVIINKGSNLVSAAELKALPAEDERQELEVLLMADHAAESDAASETKVTPTVEEAAMEVSEDEMTTESADVSSENRSPHFAKDEVYLPLSESLILNVENPDEKAVLLGLFGDTDAVLWNEELHMITPIGEAELTAYLSLTDPVEIVDMMSIHVVSEMPPEAQSAEQTAIEALISDLEPVEEAAADTEAAETANSEGSVSEETAENAAPTDTEAAETAGSDDPAAGESAEDPASVGTEAANSEDSVSEKPAEDAASTDTEAAETANSETPVTEEAVSEPAAEQENDAAAIDNTENTVSDTGETAGQTDAAAETVSLEIKIKDLNEDAALRGTTGEKISILRERFELDDETLSSLVFEVENEAVAELTERSPEDILKYGIEVLLLTEGETKLLIRQQGSENILRSIRLVSASADDGYVQTETPEYTSPAEMNEISETPAPTEDVSVNPKEPTETETSSGNKEPAETIEPTVKSEETLIVNPTEEPMNQGYSEFLEQDLIEKLLSEIAGWNE